MMFPPNSNWPLKNPACTTGVMILPNSNPPQKNLKLDRLPTPEPQSMNGPISQLRSMRTRATGLEGGLSGVPGGAGVSAEALVNPASKISKEKIHVLRNVLPSVFSGYEPQKKTATCGRPFCSSLIGSQPAACSICAASISKFEYTFCTSSR